MIKEGLVDLEVEAFVDGLIQSSMNTLSLGKKSK